MTTASQPIRWVLRNRVGDHPDQALDSDVGFIPEKISAADGRFGVEFETLAGGKSHDMELLTVDTGSVKVTFLPDRGMGIWKCDLQQLEYGWQSPVDGPVHPSLVPIFDPSGIGWLEGFDELLVRCGLHSNGAPEFDDKGILKYPLHGRIANLPAAKIEVVVDPVEGTMDITSTVRETRFLVYTLELQTRYRLRVNRNEIEVTDTVTNLRSQPTTMQLLYHINLGQPLVQEGTTVHAAFQEMSPRTSRAAEGLEDWQTCEAATPGFAEQVYLMHAAGDSEQWSEALLANKERTHGFSVRFNTSTLPYFNLWKNTGAPEDGYVVGLEPATGYPNPRSFETEQGRLVELQGGESRTFQMCLTPIADPATVTEAIARVEKLRPTDARIHKSPQANCSADA